MKTPMALDDHLLGGQTRKFSDCPELLAPAGDWDCLRAAVSAGADAVFFGMPRFNARMRAENFREEELPEVMRFLHSHGVKGYVTLNVLVFTGELEAAYRELELLQRSGVDAVIVQDVGIVRMARELFPGLRVHASTQMTVTSPEGVDFARRLGCSQVVLGRELSLREIRKFPPAVPLEVFVHGALCVAYSGQCLTSESLGQRSANRGECAQACRMPYEMVVDGVKQDLGDRKYLLSPQDLAAVREIPELVRLGVKSFKIEGRLKSADYVAAVTAVYRKALDAALEGVVVEPSQEDWYRLEMTFSRGLFSGWMHGVDHQRLVDGRYGKKRGQYLGKIRAVGKDFVEVSFVSRDVEQMLKPGDGVVFDSGEDTNREQGGRIFQKQGGKLFFEHGRIHFNRIQVGERLWKTDDPALHRELSKSYRGRLNGRAGKKTKLDFEVFGSVGQPLQMRVRAGTAEVVLESRIPLIEAETQPLTEERLAQQLGRLGETPFILGECDLDILGAGLLPMSEINRMRRQAVSEMQALLDHARPQPKMGCAEWLQTVVPERSEIGGSPRWTVLCRTLEQLEVACSMDAAAIYLDFEDIRRYREGVRFLRERSHVPVFLATPRIQKAGESGFFKHLLQAEPDGVLIRNLGAIEYFQNTSLQKVADFSLNVANPVTACTFLDYGLDRLTASYDLNIEQLLDLARSGPAAALEVVLHQHMPMFHMEHCAFAAFLSEGSTFLDCGRPCEKHQLHLRDRVGMEHPLKADVGCRNTLFNAAAQTGAQYFERMHSIGLQWFRVELLEENSVESRQILHAYQELIQNRTGGQELWRQLRAKSQLGVTRGTLETVSG